ncbi:MAG: hypothetical protein AB1608_00190 [Thermoproteota archaeon]
MQKFALLFLLLITASMSFVFGVPALAQESTEESTGEEMIDEEMTDEEMTDEELADDTMMAGEEPDEEMTDEELADDTMMEDAIAVDSPLKQLMAGTDPHEIQCKTGQQLVFKASNWRPVCINESSFDILLSRGWVSSHDPSHDDLMKMMEGIPQPEVEEMPEETEEMPGDSSIEIEEEVAVEEETTPGNDTEVEPQSYTIELRESMEMGAQ